MANNRFAALVVSCALTLGAAGSVAAQTMPVTPPGPALKATALTPLGYLLSYNGLLYGEAGGFHKAAGLDITIQAPQGSSQGIQLLLSGQAVVSRGAGVDVMNAVANNGVPVIAIGTVAHIAPQHIISSAENPIRKPADLVGKTIGVTSFGGASDQTLSLILAHSKVDQKLVKRQVVGPSAGSFGLIQEKKIDAFIGTNAAVVELRARGVAFVNFATHDEVPVPGQVYITTVENLTKKREELIRFMRGARAADEDVIAQVAANDITRLLAAVKKFNVPEASNPVSALEGIRLETRSWANYGMDNLLKNNPEAWESGTRAAIDAGVIKETPATKFYTNDIWTAAFGK